MVEKGISNKDPSEETKRMGKSRAKDTRYGKVQTATSEKRGILTKRAKTNLLGVYLLFILFVLITIPTYAYLIEFEEPLIRLLIYIGSSGGIGGTLYCIRSFYQHMPEGDFDLSWTWWYIFRPFISLVAGVFVYFLIVGGLLTLGAGSEATDTSSVMFYCAIAFLAGFSFSQVTDKLEELATTLFAEKKEWKKKDDKKAEGKKEEKAGVEKNNDEG